MPEPVPAVQLYTLRALLAEDLEGTLAGVAGLGVDTVEVAGLYGRTPAGMRAALDAAGLRACGSHAPLGRVVAETDAVIEEAAALGAPVLVVASMPAPRTAAEADRAVEQVGAAAEAAGAAGLRLAYHNHDFEFLPLDDGTDLWHRLTAPGVPWALEPDVGWLRVAGHDPVEVLRGLPGRCPLVHAKDVRPVGPVWEQVPAGEGVQDWPAVAAAARSAGAQALIAELDHPSGDPLGDLGLSLATLRAVLDGGS